jgi:dolichol kinase
MHSRSDSSSPKWPEELEPLVQATQGLQPWRRAFHAASGLAMALVPWVLGWPQARTIMVLSVLLVIAVALDLVRLNVPSVNRSFFRVLRPLASAREAAGIASSTWYLVGGILSYLLFTPQHAMLSILVLAIADPAAALVGQRFGGRRIGTGSVSGTLTFFAVATAILLLGVGRLEVALVGLAVALLETVPGIGDDNVVIPISTGILLTALAATIGVG